VFVALNRGDYLLQLGCKIWFRSLPYDFYCPAVQKVLRSSMQNVLDLYIFCFSGDTAKIRGYVQATNSANQISTAGKSGCPPRIRDGDQVRNQKVNKRAISPSNFSKKNLLSC